MQGGTVEELQVAKNRHKLIDLDQMEPSIVRRRLRRWSKADEEAITALIHALQRKGSLSNVRVLEPRYETNVYPLYFYWQHGQHVSHRQVYDQVVQSLPTHKLRMPPDELRAHVGHTVDSEVDILVEDIEYFVFIEAKEPAGDRKVKFEKKRGVHQLVSQYVQGRILQKMISKVFVLATIGANKGEPLEIKLNPAELALVQFVGEDKDVLSVVDLTWPSVTVSAKAGKQT
jgi:hypothetical protein